MNRQMLNVGIIGCGRMGKIRAEATRLAQHNLLAAFDTDNQILADFKILFSSCKTINEIENFPWNDIDVVFICSPPCWHYAHLSDALKNNKPFLVEKPFSTNAIGGAGLVHELHSKGIINVVGYMNRYRPSVQYVKNFSFLGVSSYWINKMYQVPWWANIEESGGPLNEQATHLLDLNRYILGEVDDVFANCSSGNYNFPTTISINLKFGGGQVGNILYSCDANSKNIGMDLFTSEDKLCLTGWDFNLLNQGSVPFPLLTAQDVFNIETKTFFEAVIENNQQLILSDLSDAIKTQLLADAVNSSIRTGKAVNVKNFAAAALECT